MIMQVELLPTEIEQDALSPMEKRLLETLWELYNSHHASEEERRLFRKALIKSYQLHRKVLRKSKETYFVHDLRCAIRALNANFDLTQATVMLLHELIEDDKWAFEELVQEFNLVIAETVLAVSKISKDPGITRLFRATVHIETIITAVTERHNWRAAVAKIIDRFDNTHDTAGLDQESLEQLFGETRELFIPMFEYLAVYIPPMYINFYRSWLFEISYACDNFELMVLHFS